MNSDNLHEIIARYENDLENITGELFKWRAVKAWQDAFHSSENAGSFRDRFAAARKKFAIFMDNGYQHPSTGVLKLWEKEPETVERLFTDVLLSDTDGDISRKEANMNQFLAEWENLRIKYYPQAGSYKMTPHIASVFMIMDKPKEDYAFRIKAAKNLADYIGFEEDLGKADNPNLVNYYRLCDLVVSALEEHDALLQKHAAFLTDEMYRDYSLHLMVFDLMHCSGYRHYYTGLVPTTIGKSKKRKAYKGPTEEEIARKEQERLAQIESLEQRISELELSIEDFEEISLIGVEVSFPRYGIGKVVRQNVNKIAVEFPEVTKEFKLDKAYTERPRFENDEQVVEIFTEYGHAKVEIENLQKKLARLQEE